MPLLGPDGVTPASAPAAAPEPDPNAPKQPMQVVTAYVVFQLPDGRWAASDDLSTTFISMRPPSLDDLLSGAANVQAEISARKTADMAAETTIQTQLAMARQAQQQTTPAEQAAVMAAMKGLRG